MSALLLFVLTTMYAEESDVSLRYADTQKEQLENELGFAQTQIEMLEKEKARVHAESSEYSLLLGKIGTPFFGAKIGWFQEFIERYEKKPLLYVPKLDLFARPMRRVGVLEHPALTGSHGRHDFELLQVLDESTMVVKVGTLRVCVNGVGVGKAKVGDRVALKQVFETVGERQVTDEDGTLCNIVVLRPVGIQLTDEQCRIREEEWKARVDEAKFRMWTQKYPADMRYMWKIGKTLRFEGEYVDTVSTRAEVKRVTIRDRVGQTITLEYWFMSDDDRAYVAEQAK